ncbi:MAG: BatD family protein, partial [Saprospiraceae bacterium]|nr:BatD family protein [Saprospiraceae bacterium]
MQKNVRALAAWAGTVFFLFNFQLLVAQSNVTFEAAIGVKEVVVGVPFELTFTLKNAEGQRFTAPNFSGFKPGSVSEMRGMSFVNGRSSSSQTWSLELTPIKPGTYNIGPATVQAGGRTLSTKPMTVKVLSVPASSRGRVNIPPGADDRVFVAADFDQKEGFVGQQLTWRIQLYTQLSVDGYDIISLPEFEGFFSKEKIRYDKRVEYLSLRGKKYAVRTLHEVALFPQEAGEISVGAARLSVGVEQSGTQGFLFGPKPMILQTQPISLVVKALPQPSPIEFTGGVGNYEWSVRADTNALTTDDALTIVVEVSGNGDTRRFAAPKIAVPANCEIFEPRILEEEEYEGEKEVLHRKQFEYVVLPKDTGIQEINPVLTYFDTDSNRYCQLRSETIRFKVTAGKNYQSPNKLTDALAAEPVVSQQPSLLERVIEWLSSPLLWSILVLPFLALGIFMLLKKRRSAARPTLPTDPQSISQYPHIPITTMESARQRFNHAGQLIHGGDPQLFYDELFRSLQAWLTAKFGLQPAQMNDVDVSALLLQRGATPVRTQAFLSVWHTCEHS